MGNEVNLEKVCQSIFGITSRRYRQLAEDNTVPPVTAGLIDFPLACQQYIVYLKKLAEGQGSLSLTDERIRLTKLNADLKEQQFKKEAGLLIEVETAMQLWSNVVQKIRSKLLYIPMKLAPLILGLTTQNEIKLQTEKFIREVLVELANPKLKEIAGMAGNSRNSSNAKAAARKNRKPVGRPRKNPKS